MATKTKEKKAGQGSDTGSFGNCGECLMERVEIVQLDAKGVCPKCGTNYGAK